MLGYLSKVAPKIFKSCPKVSHFTKKLLKSCFLSTQKNQFLPLMKVNLCTSIRIIHLFIYSLYLYIFPFGIIMFHRVYVLANSTFLFTYSFFACITSQHVFTCDAKELIPILPHSLISTHFRILLSANSFLSACLISLDFSRSCNLSLLRLFLNLLHVLLLC